MIQVEEHRKNAAEREQRIREAITDGHRQMILQIAETWRLLVEQRGRMAPARGSKTKLVRGEQVG